MNRTLTAMAALGWFAFAASAQPNHSPVLGTDDGLMWLPFVVYAAFRVLRHWRATR